MYQRFYSLKGSSINYENKENDEKPYISRAGIKNIIIEK